MAEYFKKNTKIPLTNKDTAVIKERLGEGGQGVIYRVEISKYGSFEELFVAVVGARI